MGPVYLRQLQLGPMKNFVYLLGASQSRETVVIDPAWDVPTLCATLQSEQRQLMGIVLTHSHRDHLNGVTALLKDYDVPVFLQSAEAAWSDNLRDFQSAIHPVQPNACLKVGELQIEFLFTPGHTPGSQCIYASGQLLTGDTLFVNACGRCDLPGGDAATMFDSLHRVIGSLPDDTAIWPGHDYGPVAVSTLAREKNNNPYFLHDELASFIQFRNRPRM